MLVSFSVCVLTSVSKKGRKKQREGGKRRGQRNKKGKPQTPGSTLCIEKEAIQDNNANGLMRNGI